MNLKRNYKKKRDAAVATQFSKLQSVLSTEIGINSNSTDISCNNTIRPKEDREIIQKIMVEKYKVEMERITTELASIDQELNNLNDEYEDVIKESRIICGW